MAKMNSVQTTSEKITGTTDAWENKSLGADAAFVRRASIDLEGKIDTTLGLHAISIRLPKDVIEIYKLLAQVHGVGYQPLMRDAICRFAEAEMKQVLSDRVADETRARQDQGLPLAA